MTIARLFTLLPCENLERLELRRSSAEAEQILSGWTALWHPVLIASAGDPPQWLAANQPPRDPKGDWIVIPACCESLLPEDWRSEAVAFDARLFTAFDDREELHAAIEAALSQVSSEIDAELIADFRALGLAYLLVELTTRQARFASNLDEGAFRQATVAAAKFATAGNADEARRHLRTAFDRLSDARDYFFPLEIFWLDYTLTAPTAFGEALREEFSAGRPCNLLISGRTLETLAAKEPETLEALRNALDRDAVELVGGEYDEGPLPLMTLEACDAEIERGGSVYDKFLGRRPVIFGRRRFGLSPALPSLLERHGFSGVAHFTLDDGRFPLDEQSRIRWEGFDGAKIEALIRAPIDAGSAAEILRLPKHIGSRLDADQAVTVVFAHWPGSTCSWYEDLRRIAVYSAALGKFHSIAAFFKETASASRPIFYDEEKYQSPYFLQAAASGQIDPISRYVRFHDRMNSIECIGATDAVAALISKRAIDFDRKRLVGIVNDDLRNVSAVPNETIDAELSAAQADAVLRLSSALSGERDVSQTPASPVFFNPSSFPRAEVVAVRQGIDSESSYRFAELPGLGFQRVAATTAQTADPSRKRAPLFSEKKATEVDEDDERIVVRTKRFEAHFDRRSGALRAIRDESQRHPRLAQQIAFRMPDDDQTEPGADSHYSRMEADEIRVLSDDAVASVILSRGSLIDAAGNHLAGFKQTTRIAKNDAPIELEIELDPRRMPEPSAWQSYYACRFAWSDETAELHRAVCGFRRQAETNLIEAPSFIDVVQGESHTVVLCGGLPYHRRVGPRRLDSLLISHGETERRFRLGVAIDPANATHAASAFFRPSIELPGCRVKADSSWFFHLDRRNVVALNWSPTFDKDGAGAVVGFRVCLMETEGRPAQLGLRALRNLASARLVPHKDEADIRYAVEGDRVIIPMGPYEIVDLEAFFED